MYTPIRITSYYFGNLWRCMQECRILRWPSNTSGKDQNYFDTLRVERSFTLLKIRSIHYSYYNDDGSIGVDETVVDVLMKVRATSCCVNRSSIHETRECRAPSIQCSNCSIVISKREHFLGRSVRLG